MKTLILSLVVLATQFASAEYLCLGEAQFIAKATQVTTQADGSCQVNISFNSTFFYSENQLCPIYQEDVVEKGFKINKCSVSVGDEISGVLVKDANDVVSLEQL